MVFKLLNKMIKARKEIFPSVTSQCHCCVSARSRPGVSFWLSEYLMWVTEAWWMETLLCRIQWPINAEVWGLSLSQSCLVSFGHGLKKICQGSHHVSYCLIFISCFILHWPPSSPSSRFRPWFPPCLDFHLRLVVCPAPWLVSPVFSCLYVWIVQLCASVRLLSLTLCESLTCLLYFVNAVWFKVIFLLRICSLSSWTSDSLLDHRRVFCI